MSTVAAAPTGIEEARYRSPESEPDAQLRDNPMALVFPAPMGPQQVYDALVRDPPARDDSFYDQPLEVRQEWLNRFDESYTPFDHDRDILGAVVELVRKSFRYRHPKLPQVFYFIMRVAAGTFGTLNRIQLTGGGSALGLLISGPTGTGKSSLIDRIVEHLGNHARNHLSLFGKPCMWPQLGVIRITVGKTWKDTLVEISKEIDRQYGRDVLFTRERHATEPRLQKVVWTALCSGFAPCIILDEFQRLGDVKPNVARHILEKLLDLMQDGGIPVIVVGTVAVRNLFESFPMEMGKFAPGAGYRFYVLNEEDENTRNFITVLKEQSVSIAPVQYSEDFDRYLLLHSMGLRRVVCYFMYWVLYRHSQAESEGLTIVADKHLLQSIAENEMLVWQKALTSMRKHVLGFGRSNAELQAYEHFVPAVREKKTQAQELTEAKWRAKEKIAHDDDVHLISVERLIELRVELAELQTQEDAARAGAKSGAKGEPPERGKDKPPSEGMIQAACEASFEPPEKSGAKKPGKPKSAKPKEPADPRSKVVPIATRRKPGDEEPDTCVDPTNLPD
jgi:DNA polymerase III delta prime subunit